MSQLKIDTKFIISAFIALLFWSGASIAKESDPAGIRSFTTDGCSLFPDKAMIGELRWCRCCLLHDLAYWRGGSKSARLQADKELKNCVLKETGSKKLAQLMYVGVRAGGGPFYLTTYRWGYGWPYGRGYQELTKQETIEADVLEQKYKEQNEQLECGNFKTNKPCR